MSEPISRWEGVLLCLLWLVTFCILEIEFETSEYKVKLDGWGHRVFK